MSRLTDLIAQAKAKDAELGKELEREFNTLANRRPFGLNFERPWSISHRSTTKAPPLKGWNLQAHNRPSIRGNSKIANCADFHLAVPDGFNVNYTLTLGSYPQMAIVNRGYDGDPRTIPSAPKYSKGQAALQPERVFFDGGSTW